MVLNNFPPAEIAASGTDRKNVFFDVSAFCVRFYSMETLVEKHGTSQLVFGSHVPYLYSGAVLHNLRNSFLNEKDVEDILRDKFA